MVKITLYNIGGYKKKHFLYCFVGFFCIRIPNIQKVKRRHVFGKKNTSASMLRYPTGTAFKSNHLNSSYDVRLLCSASSYIPNKEYYGFAV
nr:MAG TPA: hypothetical protein [Caudoviricetes sp.]